MGDMQRQMEELRQQIEQLKSMLRDLKPAKPEAHEQPKP
jgi:chaperonin cofactor prefoldin